MTAAGDDRLAVGKEYEGSIITKVKETKKTLVNGLVKVRKEIHLRGGMIMIEDSYVQPEEKKDEPKPKSKKSASKRSSHKKKDAAADDAAATKSGKENTSKASTPRATLKRAPNGGQSTSTSSITTSSRQLRTTKDKRSKSPARRTSVLSSMDTFLDIKKTDSTDSASSQPSAGKASADAAGFSKVKNAWGSREARSPFQTASSGSSKRNLKKSSKPKGKPKSKPASSSTSADSIAELPVEGDGDGAPQPESGRRLKRVSKRDANDSYASLSNHSSFGSLSHQSFGSLANKSNGSMMDSTSSADLTAEDLKAKNRAEQEAAAAAAQRRAEDEAKAEAAAAIAEARRQREEAEKAKQADAMRLAEEQARKEAEQEATRLAEDRARKEAEQKRLAEEKSRKEAEQKRLAEEKARKEAEQKRLAEEKARKEAEAKRLAAQEQARKEAEAEAEAKRLAQEKSERLAAEAEAKRLAQEKAERLAEEQARKEAKAAEEMRLAEEKKAREEAEAKRLADEKAKKEAAEEKARIAAEAKAKKEAAEEKARLAAEAKAKKKKKEDKAEKQRKKEEKQLAKAKAAAAAAASVPPSNTPKTKQKQPKIDPAPQLSTLKGAWDGKKTQQPASSKSMKRQTHPIKLQNLCASKLDESQPFEAPIHEKSFEDKKLIRRSIEDNFMFKNLPESDLAPLLDAFEKVQYDQGETIVEQGDRGVFFYVIQDGEVSFNVNGEKVGTGQKGETFGDSALVYSMPRNASVKSERSDTVLFRVGNTNFRHIMKASTLRNEDERTKLLKSVPFFQQVDEYDLKQLSAAMTPHKFHKGELLGDTFKKTPFCLIQRGSVQATDTGSGNKKAKIGPGGSFGADSLAKPESSMSNVVALTDGEALTIDRETFEKIFGNIARLAVKSMDKQTLSKVKAIKAEEPTDIELDTLVRQVSEIKYRKDRHLFYRDTETGPSLYMVRRGRVKLTTRDGKEDIITAGGYFGDEFLLAKPKNPLAPIPQKVKAKCTAVTMEETVCGLLTLQEFRTVMSHKLTEVNEEVEDEEVQLSDLQKHRVLGEGLFGKVWLVTNKKASDPEPFALKIQQTSDPHRPNAVADIRSEIKMMRHLSYPFIIEVMNVFEEEKSISMLLSLAPGGELFDIIHHQDESENWVSGIGEKKGRFYSVIVADTLAFMHRRKYVFRDLKPENILIDKDGYPVLTDFGFTKRVTDKTFTFCGTPNYLPPEIVANRGHGISADNWSLGVLIYELIEGENPFFYEGMDQMALFESICNDTYYPVEAKTSKESLDLIDRLLEKDPNQRLGTFREKDILDHKWFRYCDMKKFRDRKIEAPWKPGPVSLHSEAIEEGSEGEEEDYSSGEEE